MFCPRSILQKIRSFYDTPEIIVLHGARQVGKTSLLRIIEKDFQRKGVPTESIDLEDSRFVSIINEGVESFLAYLRERGIDASKERAVIFIDEIQYLENPSSFLKLIADHHHNLKLIISGSSSFNIKKKFHTALVGRTVNFEIWPLSFEELLTFRNSPVATPIPHKISAPTRDYLLKKYHEYCLYGGYPKIVLTDDVSRKETYLQQIIDTYIRKDIRDIGDIRDIDKFNRLLEALASQSASLLNLKEIANTCDLSIQTVEHYLFLLEETYIITRIRPWSRNKRTELFKTPKVFFNDTGMMQLLWLKNFQKEIIGNVFETSICAELIKRYGRQHIYYWRTKDKKEIDFVLRTKNEVIPIEVKLHFAKYHQKPFQVFRERYHPKWEVFTALRGEQTRPTDKYPWEMQWNT